MVTALLTMSKSVTKSFDHSQSGVDNAVLVTALNAGIFSDTQYETVAAGC